MRLAELERAIQAHVLSGGALPEVLAVAVAPPAAERWEIYSDGYRLRLVEALAAHYPALYARLGADAFDARASAFIAATPSQYRSIRDYGSELGAFIAASASGIEDDMLAELAAFEWRLAGAFDARDATPTSPADLAPVAPTDWPELQFRGVPSLRRLTTRTNAVDAWRAAQPDGPAGAATESNSAAAPPAAEREPLEWLIWRRRLATEFRTLEPSEAVALDRLCGGATFGELCETLAAERGDGAAPQAAAWLKGWLLGGVLLRV
jgi:hypothetical protein